MKYYLILLASLLILLMQICLTYFLWNVDHDILFKALLIFGPIFFLYIFYRNLKNYSKIERINNELTIKTFFSTHKYNLADLTSWKERQNYYRVSFRQLDLNFKESKIRIIDHADRDRVEQLYHFLRTHFEDLKTED